ncbi:MAG: ABC transporter ATP-binding protein [Patescibacteria group bacterium]
MGIFPVVTSKFFGNLVDSIANFIKNGNTGNVWPTLIIYTVVSIIPIVLGVLESAAVMVFLLKFTSYIEVYILKIRGELDIAHIENSKFQDLLQRSFNNGVQPIIQIMDFGIEMIKIMVIVIMSSVAILFIDWKIFLLVVVLSIPKFIIEVKYGGLSWSINAENSREQRVYQNLKVFFINKFSVIESKLFQIQNLFLNKIENIFTDFNKKRIDNEYSRARFRIFSEILSGVGMFAGLGLAINGVLEGKTSVGTIVFLFSVISFFNSNVTTFLMWFARLLERNLYASDIVEVINTKPIIKELKSPKKIISKIAPEIEFKNVSFKYPGQKNYVLKNISFKIKPGEKIGLVGHNGAGKTTIIRLLLRIHDPNKGQVLINGIDLKNLSLNDWWSKLAVLPQDFSSFNFEAKHSISYGNINKQFNLEKVKRAARQSTASDFIESWEDQYDQMIGVEFGGAELSKGERQKMALARVFYRDSQIFVLDEPTAAIDSKSTSEIFRNIEAISSKQSMLIISHNFATLRRANKIIFLDDGKIIEEGSHDELMQDKKLYSELYEQQKGEYE